MIFPGDDRAAQRLDQIKSALVAALDATARGCPARVVTAHGGAATLDAQEMAWVRAAQIFPSTGPGGVPDAAPTMRPSPVRWFIQVEMGVARCIATVEDGPTLPAAERVTADSAAIIEDARALRAVVSFLLDRELRKQASVGPWLPLPSSGGSGGGTLTVTVPFDGQDCPPTES